MFGASGFGVAAAFSLLLSAALPGPEPANDDWPHWLGPNQNGTATGDGILNRSPLRLRKAWRHPIGGGRGGLAIADGRLFALVTDGETQSALALNAEDGKELWAVPLGPHRDASLAPVSTPAVDGPRVVVLGTDCTLRALMVTSGKPVWEVDLKARFEVTYRNGCESSPFVENDRVLLQAGGRGDHRLIALDSATGELVWSAKGTERANNSSTIVADLAGVRQLVVHHLSSAPQKSGLSGFRLDDGALLWSHTFTSNVSQETPRVLPDDHILLLTWNDAKLARVTRDGSTFGVTPVWEKDILRSRISPPVFRDGHLYGFDGDDLVCVRVDTGDVLWKERIYAGSLILVDDALVILSANAGLVRIADAAPTGYRERGRLEVLNRGAQGEAPPSFAGGVIFIRNDEEIAAVVVEP